MIKFLTNNSAGWSLLMSDDSTKPTEVTPDTAVVKLWGGMGGLAIGAVGAAIVTLPKRMLEAVAERQAIKGLRSFEQKPLKTDSHYPKIFG